MVRPLEILRKMLELDARDYDYRDRAVAGGLSKYAATWRQQARQAFDEEAQGWIEDIAERLEQYSSASPVERRDLSVALLSRLEAGPGRPEQGASEEDADHEPRSTKAPEREEEAPPSVQLEREPAPEGGAQEPPPEPPTPSRPAVRRPGRGLDAPVSVMSGVGKKRSELLQRLGIEVVRDFLRFYPRRYEDYSTLKTINRLEYGERVSVLATVWEAGGRTTHGRTYVFRAIVSDATGTMEVTWFNQRHLEGRIRPGMQLLLSGKVDEYLGRLTMNMPEWEIVGRTDVTSARIQPVYPLTEGLTQRWMRSMMRRALTAWADRIPDALPEQLRLQHGLLSLSRALWGVHLPDSQEHLAAARRRLAFEEALYLQLGLLRQKLMWKSKEGQEIAVPVDRLEALKAALPYELTSAQRRSLQEMLEDLASGDPMNRLLQGDVGSGKTVVAALLMTLVADTGFQAAMMAPTEILAEQHYKSLSSLFAQLPEPCPTLALLTGSTQGVEREEIYQGLADGTLQVVVGTHALIQEAVEFKDLALVVIDEQHRFGVEQRGMLREKGYNPHLLVMTATPIPRSLELTIWGHVDVSILDEMPPGRQPVETRVLHPRERGRAYAFIQSQAEEGRQAFVIYPLVESSEKIDARAAVDEYERLQNEAFPTLSVGLLHGRMTADEKDEVMSKFVTRELDILVATSVVEVGIDVPNATVMLVDGAERFGLAQLHQLRGRVGRGGHKSHCLLLAESASAEATERLRAVEATSDGFVLAEKDLEMRGPGEFLGTQQSGFPELPMATFADTRLLHQVREVAAALLAKDPELEDPDHALLKRRVAGFWDDAGDLS
ncbi:MAG: ATP-dependent DNA helicase RecG [Anaerolineae bacterium]